MNAPFTPQCALGRLVPNAATSEAELLRCAAARGASKAS